MFKHVEEQDYFKYIVIDLDRDGEEIRGVQWANDITGYYNVLLFHKSNDPQSGTITCPKCDQVLNVTKRGNIKIIRKKDKKSEY